MAIIAHEKKKIWEDVRFHYSYHCVQRYLAAFLNSIQELQVGYYTPLGINTEQPRIKKEHDRETPV